ncbi:hypothetical protein E4U09_004714 [Claviceps aff. purpurea]|uniref:Uncharacterized protein n=1 Tax=Claviceps aff. purpurea TaxID=1967640 RepID=A0A9P7QCZ4_9HYPO|nr:hypothetical protein E4U09_004714 [Claviceps aff. purpurea]
MAGSPCATPLTVTGSLSSCRLRSNPRATFWVWSRASMASSMGGRRRAQPARAEKLKLTPSL